MVPRLFAGIFILEGFTCQRLSAQHFFGNMNYSRTKGRIRRIKANSPRLATDSQGLLHMLNLPRSRFPLGTPSDSDRRWTEFLVYLSPVGTSPSMAKPSLQLNGFYVHSSPPKVLQVDSTTIRQWLRSGDLGRLERLLLEGQGHKLLGEHSGDAKARAFLRQVPSFLVKSKRVHEAVAKGDLKQVQKVLGSIKSQESPMKLIHMSRSRGGLALLHAAAYYGHPHVIEFLVDNYPESVKMKDSEGRTALHYCGASREAGKIWPMLLRAGADPNVADSRGRLPAYYMERSNEIQLPEEKLPNGMSMRSSDDSNNNSVIKPSNIRIWIHDRDLRKLQKVIWEGHGAKLRVETSKHPKVKRFLEGVPYILNIIKDVHSAVVGDDSEEFAKKTAHPIPPEILASKDTNGLTPLHKAAGLNRMKIASDILRRNQNLVFAADQEGKTPLHYAAALKDGNAMYTLLTENYADETAPDKNGRTATYYRTNPKEINVKLLQHIPEAPRTSVTFPKAFDWSLFYSESTPITNSVSPRGNSPAKAAESPSEREKRNDYSDDSQSKHSVSEDRSLMAESENVLPEEENSNEASQDTKNFDIWTNDNYADDKPEESAEEDVAPTQNAEDDKPAPAREETPSNEKEEPTAPPTAAEEPIAREVYEDTQTVAKTEREIAEERQRLLDEGLLQMTADEGTDEESKKVNEIIEAGDMEKLASMVLNGEGDKLRGKTSSNSEIQNFLDNVPTYMAKISGVHEAVRNGSLKDLQTILDRRKFAVAKESSDKLGATPLHEAVVHGRVPIIRYLGRFPETLAAKDNFGRTALHYAAALGDQLAYDTLLSLGADPSTKDEEGSTPSFYYDNPGKLTREKLFEETDTSLREKSNSRGVSTPVTDPSIHNAEAEISFDEGIAMSKSSGNEDVEEDNRDDSSQANFSITDRDEYGQSVLHFAAARGHGRGGLFQLIHESGINLGYRDELYRTARDIAHQANIPENVNEIDKYVISLAVRGETRKLVELYLEGYDHILDSKDGEGSDIVAIASSKNLDKTLTFLKAIPALEEKREKVHKAIRIGDYESVEGIISESKNGRFLIIGKNSMGRCSLHIAVLCQQKATTEFIAQKYPETLKIGDNLERTPLHYAMGVEDVEELSKILIKCGAKRVVKDLKGRQPTYYFMNKMEILKLQEEENALRD